MAIGQSIIPHYLQTDRDDKLLPEQTMMCNYLISCLSYVAPTSRVLFFPAFAEVKTLTKRYEQGINVIALTQQLLVKIRVYFCAVGTR